MVLLVNLNLKKRGLEDPVDLLTWCEWVFFVSKEFVLIGWWSEPNDGVCFSSLGREWSDWSSELRIPGDELKWKFISDGSVNGWGWRFTVYPIMPAAGKGVAVAFSVWWPAMIVTQTMWYNMYLSFCNLGSAFSHCVLGRCCRKSHWGKDQPTESHVSYPTVMVLTLHLYAMWKVVAAGYIS